MSVSEFLPSTVAKNKVVDGRISTRARWLLIGLGLLLLAALAAPLFVAAGCFNPDQPSCSYACADADPRCPDDYECRSDGYCHLTGTTEACLFSDAAVPLDMAQPPDLTPSTD